MWHMNGVATLYQSESQESCQGELFQPLFKMPRMLLSGLIPSLGFPRTGALPDHLAMHLFEHYARLSTYGG